MFLKFFRASVDERMFVGGGPGVAVAVATAINETEARVSPRRQ